MRDFLEGIKGSLGLDVYSFSVFHVFFEQYLSIGRDAAVLLVAAAAAVTLVTLLFTASLWASAMVLLVLCMILVSSPRQQLSPLRSSPQACAAQWWYERCCADPGEQLLSTPGTGPPDQPAAPVNPTPTAPLWAFMLTFRAQSGACWAYLSQAVA